MTGALFGIWVLRFPAASLSVVISGMIFLSFLVLLTTADLKWFILPHPINNLFVASGFLSHWIRRGDWGSRNLADSLFGFSVLGAIFLVADRFWPSKMGGGDIKMMAGMGAWLGLSAAFWALTVAFTLGALVGVGALALKRVRANTKFPFGPFLAVGCLVAIFCPMGLLGW